MTLFALDAANLVQQLRTSIELIVAVLLILVLIFRYRPRDKRKPSGQPPAIEHTDPVESLPQDVSHQIQEVQASLENEICELVQVLAERERNLVEEGGRTNELRQLIAIYSEASDAMQPFAVVMQQLETSVALLNPFASQPAVGMLLKEYRALAGIGEQLAEECDALVQWADNNEQLSQTTAEFNAGNMAAVAYLRKVYECSRSSHAALPSPTQEQERMAALGSSTEERFLTWIDGVSELRAMNQTGPGELRDACTRLIHHADEMIEAWDIKLIDVPLEITRYDCHLHDLGGTLPRNDILPETVIGVRRLGHKRNGVVVRKPEVLVAAAAATV